MDAINKILADYYWIFLIVGIAILIFLIKFLIDSRKKNKTQTNKNQVSDSNSSANEPVKEMPQQPVIQQATQMLSSVPQQTYSEPTLDSLESGASEVNLGFNTSSDGMSMGEDGPMLVIDDPSTKNQEFGLVIEDPNVNNDGVSLVIEDPSLTQNNVVVPEPSIFEAAPAPVVSPTVDVVQTVAPVVEATLVENSIFEVTPAVPTAPEVITTQPVAAQSVPVQQAVAVQTTPVQVTTPVQSVAQVAPTVQTPVETMETLDL